MEEGGIVFGRCLCHFFLRRWGFVFLFQKFFREVRGNDDVSIFQHHPEFLGGVAFFEGIAKILLQYSRRFLSCFFCRPWPAARGAAFGLAWFVPVCIVPPFFVAFSPFREFCRTIGEIFTFLQFRRCTIWGLRGRMAVVIHNYHPVWFQRSGHLKWWG